MNLIYSQIEKLIFEFSMFFVQNTIKLDRTRSAQNRSATIRLPYAGPTTGLKSAKSRLYERRPLADFRLAVGPAYGSRIVANQFRADRGFNKY